MAMDTLRGAFDSGEPADRDIFEDSPDFGSDDHHPENLRDLPPLAIGQDERRMQVRAYNHWASLLGERTFPSIEDLEPTDLPDFGPHSVLLDFSAGIEDPVVQYLGPILGEECGAQGVIHRLSDVPPRSLLSRITDHYMQIMANQAPIGFEAEFVNQRAQAILYRGILLPFSSDDETIDFIYGVINWKEMADQATADELLLEIDQALDAEEDAGNASEYLGEHADHFLRNEDIMADWADSPAHEDGEDEGENETEFAPAKPVDAFAHDNVAAFGAGSEVDNGCGSLLKTSVVDADDDLPMPDFGQYALDDPDVDEEDEDYDESEKPYTFASLADYIETPPKKAVDLDADRFDPADYNVDDYSVDHVFGSPHTAPEADDASFDSTDDRLAKADENCDAEPDEGSDSDRNITADNHTETEQPVGHLPEDADLYDCLASARELAHNARASEDRSRHALYAAVGRAYDFSLAAQQAPEDYDALIEQSGLAVQERAPMTPVVKLVFGADYDKTRLTEYAAVLSHAHRVGLERGALSQFLSDADGGLKGVVTAERRLRREESGKTVEPEDQIRQALAQKLRELEALTFDAISAEGPEFALVMVRRGSGTAVEVLGEVEEDIALIERAARKLVG